MFTLVINNRIRINVPVDDLLEFAKTTVITSLELRSNNVIDMTNMDELYDYNLSFSQGSRILNCDIYRLAKFGGDLCFMSSVEKQGYILHDGYYRLTDVNIYLPGVCTPIRDVFAHIIQTDELIKPYNMTIYGDFKLSCRQYELLNISFNGINIYEELSQAYPLLVFQCPLLYKYASYFTIVPDTLLHMM